jgi:hypothetical protein
MKAEELYERIKRMSIEKQAEVLKEINRLIGQSDFLSPRAFAQTET